MNELPLNITALNDFVFCPASIYFHGLYDGSDRLTYQGKYQLDGTRAHKSIDSHTYTTSADVLQGKDVYCEKYDLIGKIDLFYVSAGKLVERKKKIVRIYDGYVWQIYAQCFALREMGYVVKSLAFHSLDDNKNYPVDLPEDNPEQLARFEGLIDEIHRFDLSAYLPKDANKCANCIYENYCDRSLV